MPDLQLTLGWVIVYVDDPAEASAFYERAFGLQPEFVAPTGTYAQMDTGATKLRFAASSLGERKFAGGVRPAGREGQPPNVELALVHADVEAAYARALDAGCGGAAAPPGNAPG